MNDTDEVSRIGGNNMEYMFNTEDLDKIIDSLNKGILPAGLPQEMIDEARIRLKELENELFDGDEPATAEDLRRHADMMERKLEDERHKAHTDNIKVMHVTERDKERLYRAVSTSIVRARVSDYNKTDDELYGDAQKKDIVDRLNNIKSIIRNQEEYMNAMKTIADAINYSLEHDYPGMKKADVLELWRNGEIKINIPIPKLFSDYVHEVTDKETLRAIAAGEMRMMTKADIDSEIVRKDYSKSPIVDYDYDVISNDEYISMVEMHRKGYDTPLSVLFNNKGKIYNQFTLSTTNMFSDKYGQVNDKGVEGFDWFQDDAATRWLEKRRGIDPFDSNIIAAILNEKNGGKLSREFRDNIRKGENIRMSNTTHDGYVDTTDVYSKGIPEKDQRTIELEQNILKAIQDSN